ncbi:hypothetical protein R6Z07M_000702 [Ovis aries]
MGVFHHPTAHAASLDTASTGGLGPPLGRPRSLLLARGRAGLAGLGSGCGAAPGQEAESSSAAAAAAAAAAAGLCLYRSPAQAAEPGPLRAETAGRGARTAGAEVSPAGGRPRLSGRRGVQTFRGKTPPPEPGTPLAPASSSRSPTRDSDPGSLPSPCLWPGAPSPRTAARAVLPGTPVLSHPRVVRPSRSAPRAPHFLGPGIPFPRLGRSLLPRLYFGVRVPAGREWPSIRTGTRAEEPAVRGGGWGALLSLGAGRAPWFPPRCGARPGNLSRPGARPIQGQKSAQSWPVFPPRFQNGTGPGGRGEAGARVRLRFRERNRQVGVYFQKRRGGAGGVRQVSARGVPVGGDLTAPGQPSPRAGPHFLLQALNCPEQTRPEKCEAF